ncbi:Signal transduction histidine kinase [Dyadobacter koreensis]|uniref:histidine kinase n=1 Tax=Dyadobacter koreensis TaxID=408657 RepID=A0A1H6XXK4_9BACT|nr:GAF domain-containing sensor histidine kinase [Dyadobacter koreensis]SEJ29315.1 Signal transduction histidine kinase [Dyadobacter koreensis]
MKLNVQEELQQASAPVPENEYERLISLANLDLDYSDHQNNFKDLAKLAAKVAGTSISLVNMIDSLTQWTISNYGMDIDQMLREDTVCQYTIMSNEPFEVGDMTIDERFRELSYVKGDPNIRYYYGVPLQLNAGLNIGSLCVIDSQQRVLDPEKIELLKIIADEIVGRLKTFKVMESLKAKLLEANNTQKKVAHDIRGPIGGIIGLASIIQGQGENNQMEEVLEFISLIHKSGNSVLELADEILSSHKPETKSGILSSNEFNLSVFREKLLKLYEPQARNKNIHFQVNTTLATETVPFSKNKLLQIAGNLISNAMKFTPANGEVVVDLDLAVNQFDKTLVIVVKDTGIGLSKDAATAILNGTSGTTDGTGGESGYGFGLALVKHLIESLKGNLRINSQPGEGAMFIVTLPQK